MTGLPELDRSVGAAAAIPSSPHTLLGSTGE